MMRRTTTAGATAIAIAFLANLAMAAPGGTSIAINFGMEEPEGQFLGEVEGPAGVLGTVQWNNFELNLSEEPAELFADVDGAETGVAATVEWVSANTWSTDGRGNEDLNDAEEDSADRALMLGYLDSNATDPVTVLVEGLDGIVHRPRLRCLRLYTWWSHRSRWRLHDRGSNVRAHRS